jgi:MFS family permease
MASVQSNLAPVLLLWVMAGIGNGVGTVAYESLLQERVPDAFRGRVLAASGAVLDGAFIAGALMAGTLGAAYGFRPALAVSGFLFLAAAAIAATRVVPGRAYPTQQAALVHAAPGAPPVD